MRNFIALIDINHGELSIDGYNPRLFGYDKAGGYDTVVYNEDELLTVFLWVVRGLRTNKQGITDIEFRFRDESVAVTCGRLLHRIEPDLCLGLSYRIGETLFERCFNFYPRFIDTYPHRMIYRMKLNSETGRFVTHLNNPWCEVGLR